ncbi:MAG: DUF2911 domain-containing protein [Ignavibacteria bacterium]|nr:DUF2911 domain-containing protein [Ignavibacteria bacterium]
MKKSLIVFTFFLFVVTLNAQFEPPRVSPQASVSQTFGYTTVTINYSRPSVHNRKIWGALVPYDKVWRAGANEATTIQFTTDVTIAGNKVAAGIYSLFMIPTEEEWTIILNTESRIWGLSHKPENDYLRFTVQPAQSHYCEQLQYCFTEVTDASCRVSMNWENLQVSFVVTSDLASQAYLKMKEAINKSPQDPSVYNACVKFAAEKEVFLNEALEWADKAILYGGGYVSYFFKAKILFAQKKYVDALRTIEKCREVGRNDKNWDSFFSQVDFLEKQIKSSM